MRRIVTILRFAGVLFVLAVLFFAWFFWDLVLTDRKRQEIFKQRVQDYFASDEAEVVVADVGPYQGGSFRIEGFVVRDRKNEKREFIRVQEMVVESGGILNPLSIAQVRFVRPEILLSRDREGGWNFERLIDFTRFESGDDDLAELDRPKLVFQDAVVRLQDANYLAPGQEHSIEVRSLILTPWPADATLDEPYYSVYAVLVDPLLGRGRIEGNWSLTSGRGKLDLTLNEPYLESGDAERFVGPIRDFLASISTQLRGSVQAVIERTAESESVHYKVTAEVRGEFRGFQSISEAPIQVQGQVVFENGNLVVGDLKARWGERTLTLDADVFQAIEATSFGVHISFTDADPNRTLGDLLGPEVERLGLVFDPGEKLLVELYLRRPPESSGYEFDLEAFRLAPGETERSGTPAVSASGWVAASEDRYDVEKADVQVGGYRIEVSGHVAGKLKEPELDLELRTVDWAFDERLQRMLGRLGEDLWRIASPEGKIEIGLGIRRQAGPEGSFRYEPRLTIRDGSVAYEGFARRFEDVTAHARLDGDDIVIERARAAYASARLAIAECRLTPDAQGEYRLSVLEAEAQGIEVEGEIRSLLHGRSLQLVEDYGLEGRFDLEAHYVRGPGPTPEAARFVLKPRGAAMRDVDFPLRFDGIEGALYYDHVARRIDLDLSARRGEGSSFTARGPIWLEEDYRLDRAAVEVDAKSVELAQSDVAALSRALSKLLATGRTSNRFDLSGRVEAEEGRLVPDIVLRPLGATLLFDEFPYPLHEVRGEVRIRPRGLGRIDLVGRNGATEFHLTNPSREEQDSFDREYDYRLRVQMKGIHLDEEFRSALSPDMQAIWTEFQPRGDVDLEFRIENEEDATDRLSGLDFLARAGAATGVLQARFPGVGREAERIEMTLRSASFRYGEFPYPFEGMSGFVRFRGDTIELAGLRGRRGESEYSFDGWIAGSGERRSLDVRARIRGLPFDEDLRSALEPEKQEIWDQFQPEGRIAVEAHMRQRAGVDTEARTRLEVVPEGDIRITFQPFPLPVTVRSGRVVLGEGAGPVFQDILAVHGDGRIQLAGRMLDFGECYQLRLTADLEGLEIDDSLRPAMERNFPGVWETLQPSGSLPEGRVEIEAGQSPEGSMQIRYRLEARIEGASLTLGYPVENACAEGWARGWIRDGEHHLEEGRIEYLDFDLKGIGFRKTSCRVLMEGPTLTLRDIHGGVMGGDLDGEMAFDTGPFHAFKGELRVGNVDVRRAARTLLGEGPNLDSLQGTLAATAEIAGVVGDSESLKARGQAEVEDGRLWSLPIFLAIFDVFELPEKPAFSTARLEFALAEGRIHISNVFMESNPLDLYGEGAMDLEGELDLYFVGDVAPGVTPRVPVLSRYWRRVKENMIPIRVSGNFDEPQVSVVPFRMFQDMVSPSESGR